MRRLTLLLFMPLVVWQMDAQTLDECRRLAREHYPEIRQFDLISQSERYDLSNAARAWIPQVVLSAQATYQSATPTFPETFDAMLAASGIDMAGMRKDQYKVALDVSQNIWDGGQSAAQREIARADAAQQRSQVEVNLYELQSRVDNLYFGILLLDERVAQTEAMTGLLESNLARMRSYYKNGVAMLSDVDAVEAELLSARQSLEQAEASRDSYRRMLELFIGQPLETGALQRPQAAELHARTSARPELVQFDAGTDKIKAQRRAVDVALMPRFSAFAQGYYGYPGLDMFKSMGSADWTLNAVVGLRMQWNIGAFYTRKNNLSKLDAAQRQIDVMRDVFLFNTELQTAQDDGEIARLRKAVADDGRIVELRRSVRMAAESRLENGVIDSTDLLRKITDETAAALSRSTHEIELLQAIYRLKHTLNQ